MQKVLFAKHYPWFRLKNDQDAYWQNH